MIPTSVNSILRGGGLCRIVIKKTKCKGGAKKIEGGYAGGGLRRQNTEGRSRKKFEGVCRKGVKKTKCGRGVVAKKIERGALYRRGVKDKMGEAGVVKKIEGGGVCRRGVE